MGKSSKWKLIFVGVLTVLCVLVIYPIQDTVIEEVTVVDYFDGKRILPDKREYLPTGTPFRTSTVLYTYRRGEKTPSRTEVLERRTESRLAYLASFFFKSGKEIVSNPDGSIAWTEVTQDAATGEIKAKCVVREGLCRNIQSWGAYLTRFFHRSFEREVKTLGSSVDMETGYKKVKHRIQIVSEGLKLGLDLKGGSELVYRVRLQTEQTVKIEDTIRILSERINAYGLKEPRIQAQGTDRILVQLPGQEASDLERMKKILQDIGHLEFRLVDSVEGHVKQWEVYKKVPVGDHVYVNESHPAEKVLVQDKCHLTGEDLASAGVNPVGSKMFPEVSLKFTPYGKRQFYKITKDNVGKRLAIILNDIRDEKGNIVEQGKLYSAPVIKSAILGDAVIEGDFTLQEATDLANILRAGSLPVALELEHERTVGPGLGEESIVSGEVAVLIAMILVLAFMIGYYLVAGVVANFALVLNLLLIVAFMALFDATLTLPGIAGLALTIGMAVDANVLIYERIKEEKRKRADKPLSLSIRDGYDRAFSAIFDSNLTTILTALVLYWVGTGPIKGFAITLSVGLVASMFTAILVTRWIIEFLVSKKLVTELKMFHILENPNLNFVGYWVPAVVVSVIVIVCTMGYFAVRGERAFDVDFRGGTLIQVSFRKPMTQEEVTKRVWQLPGLGDAEVQTMHTTALAGLGKNMSPDFSIRTIKSSEVKVEPVKADQADSRVRLDPFAGGSKVAFELAKPMSADQIVAAMTAKGYNCTVEVKDSTFIAKTSMRDPKKLPDILRDVLGAANVKEVGIPERLPEQPLAGGVEFLVSSATPLPVAAIRAELATRKGTWVLEEAPAGVGHQLKVLTSLPDEKTAAGILQKVLDSVSIASGIKAAFKDDLAPAGVEQLGAKGDIAMYRLNVKKDEKSPTAEDIRKQLVAWEFKKVEVKAVGGTQTMLSYEIAVEKEGAKDLPARLAEKYDVTSPIPRVEKIGPQVAKEMLWRAFFALLLSWVAMIAYLWFRFEFRYGVAAVIALVHDALVATGFVVLTHRPINLTIVAAILTIIGFSVNDTIVIFDRIRENLRILRRESFGEIVDLSVNQTLGRTILTTFTVLLVVVSLFIWGGGALEDFAFCMIVGCISGTYSTVYIASPIVYVWYKRARKAGSLAELAGRRA